MPSSGIFCHLPKKVVTDVAFTLLEHHNPVTSPVKLKEPKDALELCTLQQVSTFKGPFGEVANKSVVDELILGETGKIRLFNASTTERRYDSNAFYNDLIIDKRIHTLTVIFSNHYNLPKQISAFIKAVKCVTTQISIFALEILSKEQARTVLRATIAVERVLIQPNASNKSKKNSESIGSDLDKAIHEFLIRVLKEGHSKFALNLPYYKTQESLVGHVIDAFANQRLKEAYFKEMNVTKEALLKIHDVWRTNGAQHLLKGKIITSVKEKNVEPLKKLLESESFGAKNGPSTWVEREHPFSRVDGRPCTMFIYLYNRSLSINFRVQERAKPHWLNARNT
ncbi:hypothetical protein L596_006783 [Steinernema carpocapsae]|uniref:Uncharacterized protein n=1 Tax=Steinernema carpocapsae TaxID=34508 RepID=A0A4U5P882_STECR|nr:hypothetical protein L596_006783 [Steinernema carpocapsae]